MERHLRTTDPAQTGSAIKSWIEKAVEANARGEHVVLRAVPGEPCFSTSWEVHQQISPELGGLTAHVHAMEESPRTDGPTTPGRPFWLGADMRGSTIEQAAGREPLLLMVEPGVDRERLLEQLGGRPVMEHDLAEDLGAEGEKPAAESAAPAAGTTVGQLMNLGPEALAERVQSLADHQLTGLLRLAQTGLEESLGKATRLAEADRAAHCARTLHQADRYARVCQALVRELIMRS